MYLVQYRRLGAEQWDRIENVVGDGIMENVRYRYFDLADGTRHEVPMESVEFTFSPKRAELIAAKLKAEAEARATAEQGEEK